jgi:hypothetical protein
MPLCMRARSGAEALEVQSQERAEMRCVHADGGVPWLLSFLSASTKKTYCLYEATPDNPAAFCGVGAHGDGGVGPARGKW